MHRADARQAAAVRPRGGERLSSGRRVAALATFLLSVLAVWAGAPRAAAETTLYVPAGCGVAEPDQVPLERLLDCHAPAFLAPETDHAYNRIGSPRIRRGRLWGLRVHVDPEDPAIYGEVRRDTVGGRGVVQLVYRVHFEKIPLRFSRSFYESHDNPGLLVVVTLDEATHTPLFVTTVHTCGCYRAVIPTEHVRGEALPPDWPEDRLRVYGSSLPVRVPAPTDRARLLLVLKPHNHRVVDLRVGPLAWNGTVLPLPQRPMRELRDMPVEGGEEARRASIFYQRGPLAGHVRGAWNAWEGLFVFSWVSLDPSVGMDKDFGASRDTGTPFYTSLRFWKQGASRLDRFESLLRHLGFRVEEPLL